MRFFPRINVSLEKYLRCTYGKLQSGPPELLALVRGSEPFYEILRNKEQENVLISLRKHEAIFTAL
jgi:hypothetical protein